MPKAFDKMDRQGIRTQWKWTAGIAATFIMLALIALTWSPPSVTNWVSDAAEAEFANTMTPEQGPVQTAQPAKEWHTVRSN